MLNRVTITGADDNTPIMRMLELSREYPWLEWGILASQSREGSARYPSRSWCSDLATVTNNGGEINLSMHVCGQWARMIFAGDFDWSALPPIRQAAQRVQVNGSSEVISTRALQPERYKQYIFQLPRSLPLVQSAQSEGIPTAGLFDESGGEGVSPVDTSVPIDGISCGYAGGIGPDNVVERVGKIKAVCRNDFWIDMEGRVRTEDRLDLDKVKHVLEQVQPYVMCSEARVNE